jgi:hypothetical protein
MSKAFIAMLVGAVAIFVASTAFTSDPKPHAESAAARPIVVGTYDNRAVAIAYAASDFNPVSTQMQKYKAAEEAGDQETMAELEAWGQTHQRQLHRQGFCRVSVTDLLEHVKDQLPAVADKTGVDVIAFDCNYHGKHVELVDVTLEIVALYHPDKKVMNSIVEIMKHEPVDLDVIEQHHEH